jgi:aminoglycoside phosphotransferase (APT) family kinase protein
MQTHTDSRILLLDLSAVLGQSVTAQEYIWPQHPGQANYVFRVAVADETWAVKSPRVQSIPDEDFWQGALRLFEADVRQVDRILAINRVLAQRSPLEIPPIRHLIPYGERVFRAEDWMSGQPLTHFDHLNPQGLRLLGRHFASVHQARYDVFGSPLAFHASTAGQPLDQFFTRVAAASHYLLSRYYSDDEAAHQWQHKVLAELKPGLRPLSACPIMLDLDPTQFLCENGRITALVDSELYVLGPPEWELVGLECLLSPASACLVRAGYEEVATLPPLAPVRDLYRLMLRLMSFQGPVEWGAWMAKPRHWP